MGCSASRPAAVAPILPRPSSSAQAPAPAPQVTAPLPPALEPARASVDSAGSEASEVASARPARVPRLKHISEKYLLVEDASLGGGAAAPMLGKGSFGDVLLGWRVLPREEGESAVQWLARCRAGRQLAIKRIRPMPTIVSPKVLGGLMGMVRAKSKFLKLASRRTLGPAAAAAAAQAAAGEAEGAASAPQPAVPAPAAAAPSPPKKREKGGMFNSSKTRLRDRDAVRQEADILRLLAQGEGCEHVVKLVDHVEDDRVVYLVMELVGGGDLTKWLKGQSVVREEAIAAIFLQLLRAVQHLQAHGVCHRDIKPENILVYDHAAAAPRVCLCDFGLAARLGGPQEVMSDIVGTAYFLAPEVLQQRYTMACDQWSLGVNLYLLLCGTVPFGAGAERTRDVHRAILDSPVCTTTPEWAALSPLAKDLIMGLLDKAPERRYTVKEALAHKWFTAARGVDSPPHINPAVIKSMVSFVSANRLRARALGIVAECLTAREAAQLRAQFFQIDLNSDMNLSQAELGVALANMGLKMAAAQLTRFMQAIDTDGSGFINLNEFLAATAELSLQQHKESAVRAFARFDLDGDGLISLEEAKAALRVSDEGQESKELADMMALYDTQGVGLSFVEFWRMLNPHVDVTFL